jgi:hypothetical protein
MRVAKIQNGRDFLYGCKLSDEDGLRNGTISADARLAIKW